MSYFQMFVAFYLFMAIYKTVVYAWGTVKVHEYMKEWARWYRKGHGQYPTNLDAKSLSTMSLVLRIFFLSILVFVTWPYLLVVERLDFFRGVTNDILKEMADKLKEEVSEIPEPK